MSEAAASPWAAEWKVARDLYPLYQAIASKFNLEAEPCEEFESKQPPASSDGVLAMRRWFERLDSQIEVFHIRETLQTTTAGSERCLRIALARHLGRRIKGPGDRDKIDFLLVQYFAQANPYPLDRDVSMLDVATVMQPVLGRVAGPVPAWTNVLDEVLKEVEGAETLEALLDNKIVHRARHAKVQAGLDYYHPAALLACTRFNYLVRRRFFRLMHAEVQTLRRSLARLQSAGIASLDAQAAGFSAEEPIANLMQVCHQWRQPFRAPYNGGQGFQSLIALRRAAEAALAGTSTASSTAVMAAHL